MKKPIPVADFDPNVHQQSNVWGVYNGSFKTYKNRGPALNKVMHASSAKLFENVNGTWVERAYKPKSRLDFSQRPCDICGAQPLAALPSKDPNHGPSYAHGHWAWERKGSKVASPPNLLLLCYTCVQNVG